MLIYTPSRFERPKNLLDVPSAWRGLEWIIKDIIETFGIKTEKALEFGVEYGFSTMALSNYFTKVIGVDTFLGDEHSKTEHTEGLYEAVRDVMPKNVQLYPISYQEYIKKNYLNSPYDLIHIDIVHTYKDTFDCGDWAIQNSKLVIFHDTESFKDVMRAVQDLASKHNVEFYNYPKHYGLGMLWRK